MNRGFQIIYVVIFDPLQPAHVTQRMHNALYGDIGVIGPNISVTDERYQLGRKCQQTIYRVVQKKWYPSFNFAITSVNVHRF